MKYLLIYTFLIYLSSCLGQVDNFEGENDTSNISLGELMTIAQNLYYSNTVFEKENRQKYQIIDYHKLLLSDSIEDSHSHKKKSDFFQLYYDKIDSSYFQIRHIENEINVGNFIINGYSNQNWRIFNYHFYGEDTTFSICLNDKQPHFLFSKVNDPYETIYLIIFNQKTFNPCEDTLFQFSENIIAIIALWKDLYPARRLVIRRNIPMYRTVYRYEFHIHNHKETYSAFPNHSNDDFMEQIYAPYAEYVEKDECGIYYDMVFPQIISKKTPYHALKKALYNGFHKIGTLQPYFYPDQTYPNIPLWITHEYPFCGFD